MKKKKRPLKGDAEIGKRVKEFREKNHITQKALAEKVMISPSSITRLELGETMVSIFTMMQIAEVLNVSISSILEEYEELQEGGGELLELSKKLGKCTPEQRRVLIQSFENIINAFSD